MPPTTPREFEELALLDQLMNQEQEEAEVEQAEEELGEMIDRYQLEKLMRQAERKAMAEENPILPIAQGGSFFHERQRQLEEDALNQVLGEMEQQGEEVEQPEVLKRKVSSDGESPHTSFREVALLEHIPAVSYYRDPHQVFEDSDWVRDSAANAKVLAQPEELPEEAIVIPGAELPSSGTGGGIYTEGGMVYLPTGQGDGDTGDEGESREEARSLLANMLGFTRHERLDVKKPGPLVVPPEPVQPVASNSETVTPQNKEILPSNIVAPTKSKKLVIEGHQTDDHGIHSVDATYAHVKFTNPVDNWREGQRIVQAIGEQVNLSPYLSHIRVAKHEVSFKVDDNPEKKTAIDVARAINHPRFKSNLSRRLGVNVIAAGIGDKTQAHEGMTKKMVTMTQDSGIDSTHLMVYMFIGAGVAALVVAVITLFVIKRHDQVKSKLVGLATGMGMGIGGGGGVDSSKDYQDLCRARMAGKGGSNDSPVPSGRITSLTKENERPPSSRSSTSSWSEEPITNMDISTGHMVLSYMEDHLRNKGRLQREWEALCRYEAEPNSRDAAMQESSEKLNRDGAPLPFDHSRVVLNHLANAEGLDYINASTIVSNRIEIS